MLEGANAPPCAIKGLDRPDEVLLAGPPAALRRPGAGLAGARGCERSRAAAVTTTAAQPAAAVAQAATAAQPAVAVVQAATVAPADTVAQPATVIAIWRNTAATDIAI